MHRVTLTLRRGASTGARYLTPLLARWGVAAAVLVVGTVGLTRSSSFYGTLLFGWDAQFYYATARSLAIDGDLDITNDLALTSARSPFDRDRDGVLEAVPRRDGRIVSKYTLGLSLLEAPSIALGSALRVAAGFHREVPIGYGPIEINLTAFTLLAVFASGCQALHRLLLNVVSPFWSCAAILAAWIGTTQFYFTAVFPFMTHGVAFALVIGVVAAVSRAVTDGDANRHLATAGILGTLLFLVRPQQMTLSLVLLPMLVRIARRSPGQWIPGAITAATMAGLGIAIQVFVNHMHTATWTFNAYSAGGEYFHWTRPDWYTVLWSGSRGLITITPIVGVALCGYCLYWHRAHWTLRLLLLHGVLQLYIIAAWSNPAQGESFGSRMWGENAGAVAAGLVLWSCAARPARIVIVALSALACAWTLVLLWAYMNGLMTHPLAASGLPRIAARVLGIM